MCPSVTDRRPVGHSSGVRVCFVLLLCVACGARSQLDGAPPVVDASSPVDVFVAEPPCQALEYYNGITANAFAVTSDWVYFEVGGNIVREPKDGGTQNVFWQNIYAESFVADDAYLYLVDSQGQLTRAPADGSAPEALGCAVIQGCPPSVDTDVTVRAESASYLVIGQGGLMFVMNKTGGPVQPLYYVGNGPTTPPAYVEADDTRAVWSTTEHIFAVPFGTTTVATIYTGSIGGIALTDGTVYWTAEQKKVWHLMHSSTSDPIDLGPTEIGAPIGANESSAYGEALSVDGGGIARSSIAGGATTTLNKIDVPKKLIVQGACVYYTTPSFDNKLILRRIPG